MSDIQNLLRAVPVFASLPQLALQHLAEHSHIVAFAKQAIICRKGDPGDSLFIVKSGQVEIVLPEEDDRETRVALLSAGEFFGELAVLDSEPRSATARACTDSEVLILRRGQLFQVLREPNVLENVLVVVTSRVRAADQLVAARGIDNRKLEEEALTDALTGLGNRRKLGRDLDELEARCHRYGHTYALALCDIDHFKQYNDTYGHARGDEVLRAVAQTMAHHCRTGDEVYRYGGEEFLVVMPAQTENTAWVALERLREAVQALGIEHSGNPPSRVVTFSGGIASLSPGSSASASETVVKADEALYEAKKEGRNRVAKAKGD